MTRQTKTERQRAEEALEVAARRHTRLNDHVTQLRTDLKHAETELAEAKALLEYRQQHPALKKTDPATTSGGQTSREGTTA